MFNQNFYINIILIKQNYIIFIVNKFFYLINLNSIYRENSKTIERNYPRYKQIF